MRVKQFNTTPGERRFYTLLKMTSKEFNSVYNNGTVPTENYVPSVDPRFPRISREYLLETGMERKYKTDILPTNNYNEVKSGDRFLDFVIKGATGVFTDLASLSVDLKIQLVNSEGEVAATENVMFVDGVGLKIFQTSHVGLNNCNIEANPHFGTWNHIKFLCMTDSRKYNNLAPLMGFHENTIREDYTGYFNGYRKEIQNSKRRPLQLRTLLLIESSSTDMFICDNLDLKIRLGLAPASSIILTDNENANNFSYQITECKLWCDRYVPNASSLLSFNKSLNNNSSYDFLFTSVLTSSFTFLANTSSLVISNIFNSVIPREIFMVMIDQDALVGNYKNHSSYYQHAKLSSADLRVNGESVTNFECSFNELSLNAYFSTLENLNLENCFHTISLKEFNNGRSIFVFRTGNTNSSDGIINVERTGNTRLYLKTETPVTKNLTVLLFGTVTKAVSVNASRRVSSDAMQ